MKKTAAKGMIHGGSLCRAGLRTDQFQFETAGHMSHLTFLVKSSNSTMSDILYTGADLLECALASVVLCITWGYLTAKAAAGFSFSIHEALFNMIAILESR